MGAPLVHELSREIRKLLERMVTKTPALALRRKGAVFTEPVLVAEVEYRCRTGGGLRRDGGDGGHPALGASAAPPADRHGGGQYGDRGDH
ncbi:hypothetical protein BMJ34_18390 [Sinorhizobium medicae]|uniref:DNA ligase (ATP) n=1 Tax=Sinorhizobium medicae TaxID=110321 RepID=A0ABX4TEQ2_9HYPH|nr:hypothetical protein BMJ33_27760 [Sinorhizobium medicae]PLT97292.1 hypothetical protein BMJ34_18390 [Sinorhizobium medicae]PLU74910.1 hypothetical protein BMJ19_35855 [Sinorhizobium medicae]